MSDDEAMQGNFDLSNASIRSYCRFLCRFDMYVLD